MPYVSSYNFEQTEDFKSVFAIDSACFLPGRNLLWKKYFNDD